LYFIDDSDFLECEKIKEAAQGDHCPVWAEWGEWSECPPCNSGSNRAAKERDRACSGIKKRTVGSYIPFTPEECAEETGQPIREKQVCQIPSCRPNFNNGFGVCPGRT